MRPILAHSFSKLSNPKDIYELTSTTRQQSPLASLRWGKRGIKIYGKREVLAMLDDYKQLYNLDVFSPKYPTIIYRQEDHRVLRAIYFIKEKLCG